MSAVVGGFLDSKGFKHFKTVRPDPRLGEISIYQRRGDGNGNDVLYTASSYGGIMFLSARRYASRGEVTIDAPCPNPQTDEQVQAAILNAIEQKRGGIPEGDDAHTLLDACERVITT